MSQELKTLIREVFMQHGFTIKQGQTDLKPYVYEAALALLARTHQPEAAQQPAQVVPEDVRDAARYRRLRDSLSPIHKGHTQLPRISAPFESGMTYTAKGFDDAIDAVIAASQHGEGAE